MPLTYFISKRLKYTPLPNNQKPGKHYRYISKLKRKYSPTQTDHFRRQQEKKVRRNFRRNHTTYRYATLALERARVCHHMYISPRTVTPQTQRDIYTCVRAHTHTHARIIHRKKALCLRHIHIYDANARCCRKEGLERTSLKYE